MISKLTTYNFNVIPNAVESDTGLVYQVQNVHILAPNFNSQIFKYVALQMITFPQSFYQINEDFRLIIGYNLAAQNWVDIQFHRGRWESLQQLIAFIQQQCNQQQLGIYQVQELHTPQQSGKIWIRRNDLVPFTIHITNNNYINFFGNLQNYQGLNHQYASRFVCDLNCQIKPVFIRSDCCNNIFQHSQNMTDVLHVFDPKISNFGQYYIQYIPDVIQKKNLYNKNAQISFSFVDSDNNYVKLNSPGNINMTLAFFSYDTIEELVQEIRLAKQAFKQQMQLK